MSYVTMLDLDVLDVVGADEMDAIRENIEQLHLPNHFSDVITGTNVAINSTSWVKVSAAFDKTFQSAGGVWDIEYRVPTIPVAPGGVLYLTFYIDGVNVGNTTYGVHAGTVNYYSPNLPVRWVGEVSAGEHTVELYARVSSGSNTWQVTTVGYPLTINGTEN